MRSEHDGPIAQVNLLELAPSTHPTIPDRRSFIATLDHPAYPDVHRHRAAGLLCQELLTTRVRTSTTGES